MPYADLHAGDARLFVQPIVSTISGVDRPTLPIDTTGADMLQSISEAEVAISKSASLQMSAGRKLISLGAGRFIDARYGPNIPQAFDGIDTTLTGQTRQVTWFYFRPVDNAPATLTTVPRARRRSGA